VLFAGRHIASTSASRRPIRSQSRDPLADAGSRLPPILCVSARSQRRRPAIGDGRWLRSAGPRCRQPCGVAGSKHQAADWVVLLAVLSGDQR